MKNYQWLLMVVASGCLAGCTAHSESSDPKNTPVEMPVTRLIARDTVLQHGYVADIQSVRNVELRARVPGFLEKVFVDEGREVKKGQLLFQINDEEYEAELAKARATLTTSIAEAKGAELEMDRVRLLVEKKVISKTELEVASAKLKAANARIDEAKSALSNAAIRLSYTQIKSPFDGIIDRLPLKVGSLIDKGTLLTTVSDARAVYAYFNVSENEYLEYAKALRQAPKVRNNRVRLVLADGSAYPQEGVVETMEGEFQESTGSIAFRARFANPDKLLKHGATGTILLTNSIKATMLVPQKAVFEMQDRNYVFVVDSSNRVRMRSFVPKTRFSHFYLVESGLSPGDRIVCEGVQDLREGVAIVPKPVSMDSLLASAHSH